MVSPSSNLTPTNMKNVFPQDCNVDLTLKLGSSNTAKNSSQGEQNHNSHLGARPYRDLLSVLRAQGPNHFAGGLKNFHGNGGANSVDNNGTTRKRTRAETDETPAYLMYPKGSMKLFSDRPSYNNNRFRKNSFGNQLPPEANKYVYLNIPKTRCNMGRVSEEAGRRCTNYYCRTNTTPLWRGGPLGPKTLCNACGILFSKTEARSRVTGEQAGFNYWSVGGGVPSNGRN